MTTNVGRLLAAHSVHHRFIEYSHDPGAMDAVSVARRVGIEPERVFKTLVARGDCTGVVVFCVPGPLELDLKKAAAVSGNKRVALLPVSELRPLTGYLRGACSPIGMTKRYSTWIDETSTLFAEICISAGIHGGQIALDPHALAAFIDADFADLT